MASALVLAVASGCRYSKDLFAKEKGATYEDDGTRSNKSLGLITPEQFTGNIAAALGANDERKLRRIMRDKAVALGGVDFRSSEHRNRTPTGQSQLTIRRLAWDTAKDVVERDSRLRLQGQPPVALTIANVAVDRPFLPEDIRQPPEVQFAIQEGDKRFREQLDDLYWRLLSRPPSDAERKIMTDLFIRAIEEEGSTVAAWTGTVFVLLASMEYWNI